jgi:hypothetical protein
MKKIGDRLPNMIRISIKQASELTNESPEMKFLNGILAEVSGHKLESSQNQVLVWISTLIFPFYKLLFKAHTKTRFPIGQILDMYIIESAWLYLFLIVIYFMHSKSPMTNID